MLKAKQVESFGTVSASRRASTCPEDLDQPEVAFGVGHGVQFRCSSASFARDLAFGLDSGLSRRFSCLERLNRRIGGPSRYHLQTHSRLKSKAIVEASDML